MKKIVAYRPRRRDARLLCERFLSVVLSIFLTLAVAPATWAQTDYGSLVVLVLHNESGAPAPKVTVSLTGELGRQFRCDTNDEGRCVFGSLDPGDYRIQMMDLTVVTTAPDFIDVHISPGQHITRSFIVIPTPKALATRFPLPPLAPGPARLAETVTPGRLGVTETARTLEKYPNRDRRFSSVFDLLSGAFNDATDNFGGVSFNGQPGSQNVLREDSINITPIVLSSTSFQDTGALIFDVSKRQSFKKYKSFQISTSNYPSDLGTGTGAELIANIEGGGEGHHGEVYEYFANDALSARNFFDFARKPELRFNLFGVKVGGPIYRKDKDTDPQLFYFVNYEGIRAHSGHAIFEAVPSLGARGRASAATAALFDSFRASSAKIVPGASADPDFDILRLDSKNFASKNSLTTRINYNLNKQDTLDLYLIAAKSEENTPVSVTDRRQVKRDASYVFGTRYEHLFKTANDDKKISNEFIFSVNSTPARLRGDFPSLGGVDLSLSAVSIGGEVAQTGIPGQPFPLGVAIPGGLLAGSDFGGRSLRFTPTTFSFIDKMRWVSAEHSVSVGGELRLIRASINQLFGTTYRFSSLGDLLANRASVEHVGDLGSFNGVVGGREARQGYYVAYALDEWNPRKNLRLAYGLRYEYYSVLRETRDRSVIFDPASGTLMPPGTPFYRSRKNNFLPRISFAWAPIPDASPDDINTGKTVFSASFGMYTGPDVFDHLLRPITSDFIRVTQEGAAFPADTAALASSFAANVDDRRFRPLALSRDYKSPALVYKFDATLKRDLIHLAPDEKPGLLRELFLTLSYVGNRSRGLLLRNFANPIVSVETNSDPTRAAIVRREFDVIRDGRVLSPFGEIEYLTTGGRARFDSLQVTLKGRAKKFLDLFEAQYTLGRNFGNTTGDDKTTAAGNPLDFDYDLGYNGSDVRHKFSFGAVFIIPCELSRPCRAKRDNPLLRELFGGWSVGVIGNFQTGSPIDIRVKRPDVVYVDASGNVFGSPADGRRAVLNVPGGGSSVAAYRPDLIPGVNPYLAGFADRRFLNPAAFAMPAPGALGNLPRGLLRGPGSRLVDLSLKKEMTLKEAADTGGKPMQLKFGVDITNLFNFTNFKLSSATLPNKLGLDASSQQLQPGQPFTAEAAGTFGVLSRTFKRQQDLGASRQIQLSVSFAF